MTSRIVPTHTVASDLERAEALIRRADALMEEAERILDETDERLRQSLADRRIRIGEKMEVTVTASFGVAEIEDGQSEDALLRAADSALYRAKELGKNRVEGSAEQSDSRAV